MNRLGIPESEQPSLLAYLKKTYRYEDGDIINRKTGRRRTDAPGDGSFSGAHGSGKNE